MRDFEHLPQELQVRPKCLIVLTGLDVDSNPFHASVWKGFSQNRRSDRAPLKFKNLPLDHAYPKTQPKYSSQYEWYLPKGLLKRNWMKKHLDELPAVVVVFFDLEWNEKDWHEKVKECVGRVNIVRSNLISRPTKVVVVLLQSKAPNQSGDEVSSTERAQELCNQCQLNVKNLFVLQQSDFMFGCITRLETELHDMASNYYHNAAKRVKAHKSSLNKSTHQLLFVRHDFKIAFFDELKQDSNLALKHYRQAYNHLLEMKMTDADLLEFKVVAGFINFKICRIFFQLHAPEAIAQFRRHIDFFKSVVGMPELAFEHEAWLSMQYEIFGELFDEATRLSVHPLLTQHPGLYFHEAGRHMLMRRSIANQLGVDKAVDGGTHSSPRLSPSKCKVGVRDVVGGAVRVYKDSEHLPGDANSAVVDPSMEYFGQHSWQNPGQIVGTTDRTKEREGIMTLQATEAKIDYSELIIPLFTRASHHFERYNAKRMQLYPIFCIAEEFFLKEEYENALDHYCKIVDEFRHFGWKLVFTSICHRILQCALKLKHHSMTISFAMELLSDYSDLTQEEKESIHQLIFLQTNDFQDIGPVNTAVGHCVQEFESTSPEIIDLSQLKSCVEVKAEFAKPSFSIDEPVRLVVFLKSFAPLPLPIDSLLVKLNSEALHGQVNQLDGFLRDASTAASSPIICYYCRPLILMPSDLKVIVFTIDPAKLASGLQVVAIEASFTYLGDCSRPYCFRWLPSTYDWLPLPTPVSCNYTNRLDELKRALVSCDCNVTFNCAVFPRWEFFRNRLTVEISPKASKLEMSLRHMPPPLCSEKYVILCQVQNTESSDLTNLTISANLADDATTSGHVDMTSTATDASQCTGVVHVGQSASQSAPSCADGLYSQAFVSSCLAPGADLVCPIFVHCPTVAGDRSLRVDAQYSIVAQLPAPGAKVLSLNNNGKVEIVESETPHVSGSELTLTRCFQSKRVQLSAIPPLEINARILSLMHAPVVSVVVGRPFILEVALTNCSPWAIEIEKSTFNFSPGVLFKGNRNPPNLNVPLNPYETCTEVQVLILSENGTYTEILNLGQYSVNWKRLRPQVGQDPSFPKATISTVTFDLPSCALATLPFSINLSLPPFGLLHSPFTVTYALENKTPFPQELHFALEPTEGFVFCGVQLTSLHLLPNSSKNLDFTLLPLCLGYIQLPRCKVWSGSKTQPDVDALTTESPATLKNSDPVLSSKTQMLHQLQSHIFIMPQLEGT
uniref:Trafficking protein particle complex subunit 11 n=1 Tax=Mesocestoides corti TaxID=53468 RepID=A0A5K3FDS2_MESCO